MLRLLTTSVFDDWLLNLRDKAAASSIQVRIARARNGSFGDCAAVGGGVSEMRVHLGPGYRIYFARYGKEIVILLAGGDKSSQRDDIKRARQLLRDIRGIE
jgi:putative addiction module killer protein